LHGAPAAVKREFNRLTRMPSLIIKAVVETTEGVRLQVSFSEETRH
jgi:hypothetical protein